MASVIWNEGMQFQFRNVERHRHRELNIRTWVQGNRVVIAKGNIWNGIKAKY